MKQAIQEGFTLDVLAHSMPVVSYYKLAKTVEDDPEFDTKKAQKKLRRFVEGHEHAIRLKAEIMVDHFHAEKRAMQATLLEDQDAEIEPVPIGGGGGRAEPDLDHLSNIITVFNDHFGDIPRQDADRVRKLITETIPARVGQDQAYRNAQKHSDKQNARIEHDKVLLRVMTSVIQDDTELFKQFMGKHRANPVIGGATNVKNSL